MNDRRHSGEHRLADTQEAADLPREDRLPSWSIGTWVVVFGAITGICAFAGAIAVTEYQVTQLEAWRKDHSAEIAERQRNIEARFRSVEDAQRAAETSHDHRLTVLEERWGEVLTRLQRIETKLDEKHGH